MTKLIPALAVACLAGCAARSPYSTAVDPTARFGFGGGTADRCVFGNVENLCLRGVSAPVAASDLEGDVLAGIRQHLATFESRCESPDRTDVVAMVGVNGCIDCGPGAQVLLHSSAHVTANQQGIGQVDAITWVDERGGTFRQVAFRLGVAVGEFVVNANKACVPPNHGLQPAAAGWIMGPPRLKPRR
jgi:hypothetical protein